MQRPLSAQRDNGPTNKYTNMNIYKDYVQSNDKICTALLILSPIPQQGRNTWKEGLACISHTYTHNPPDFRSILKDMIKGKNQVNFEQLTLDIICAILAVTTNYKEGNENEFTYGHFGTDSAPF